MFLIKSQVEDGTTITSALRNSIDSTLLFQVAACIGWPEISFTLVPAEIEQQNKEAKDLQFD